MSRGGISVGMFDIVPETLRELDAGVRDRAGAALERVADAERLVRTWWKQLATVVPNTGTRPQLQLLERQAAALVEGERSRLSRAMRSQSAPWHLDDEPLAGTLRACLGFETHAKALCRTVDLATHLAARYESLSRRFADVPRAWQSWTAARGITAQSIDLAQSEEVLRAFDAWLVVAEDRLEGWQRELAEWLGTDEGVEQLGLTSATSTPTVRLEARYELLLAVGEIDRRPMQNRTAALIRAHVCRHIGQLAVGARIGREDAMLRIAEEYATSRGERAMAADEVWTYMRALAYYRARHSDEGAEGG